MAMKMLNISTILTSDEDQVLNGIWIGLLSVEALMVLGVAVRGLVGAVSSRFMTHPAHAKGSSSSSVGDITGIW
jgi:hypothetical protein